MNAKAIIYIYQLKAKFEMWHLYMHVTITYSRIRFVANGPNWFTFLLRIGDFLRLAYVNEYWKNQTKMAQTLRCFGKCIESIQSHRPEEAIPDSYDKCEPSVTPAPLPYMQEWNYYQSSIMLLVAAFLG